MLQNLFQKISDYQAKNINTIIFNFNGNEVFILANILKERLKNGEFVIGTFLNIANPAIPEIIGLNGFDFLVLDFEHTSLDFSIAENLIRAAQLVSCSTIIRTADKNPSNISRALDIGADAIQIPQVGSLEEAEMVIKNSKFFPSGERGASHYVRAARYSNIDKIKYYTSENDNTLIIIQIEGANAIKELDEILKIKEIDVIFIGPVDLSMSLGVPGEINHPLVEEKVKEIIEKARNSGKSVGTYVEDLATFEKRARQGVKMLTYWLDVGLFYNACKESFNSLKSIINAIND